MKPYEEIEFPNGLLRWIREDGHYVCRMTEEYIGKMKELHEAKPKQKPAMEYPDYVPGIGWRNVIPPQLTED